MATEHEMTLAEHLEWQDRQHPGCCEECGDELPLSPMEAEGLKFCGDTCFVRWLGLVAREWGCGAFMGSVEGGEVRS